MRRALSLATVAAGLALAGAAQAQSEATPGQAAGLRYLSWTGRGAAVMPVAVAASSDAPRPDLRRPNRVIPHGGFASAVAPTAAAPVETTPAPRRTLTPAPRVAGPTASMVAGTAQPVPPQPVPAQPVPVRVETLRPAPVETRSAPTPVAAAPIAAAPTPPPQPEYLRGNGQAVPTAVLAPTPMEQPPVYNEAPADPMAPRRDAPIFRMQRPQPAQPAPEPAAGSEPRAEAPSGAPADAKTEEAAPRARRVAEVTNSGERPPTQGARYYSVHRQTGRQPDTLSIPNPTYIDALAVTLAETPSSQDLAQPDQGPTLIRDRDGKVRAAPAPSMGDHQ